jgi:hypothetical protein
MNEYDYDDDIQMSECKHDDDKCEYWYMGICELDDRLNVCPHSELYKQLPKFGGHINESKEPDPTPTGGLYGWICPKCGAVMSPFQSYCVKCSSNWEITYGTGTFYNTPMNGECNGGHE